MNRLWKTTAVILLLTAAITATVLTVAGRNGNTDDTAEALQPEDSKAEEYVSINEFLTNDMCGTPQAAALDSYIERFMRRWEIKGGSLAVMKDGRLIYSKGYGWADEEKGIPMSPGHIMRIASLSKLITATAIMQLCERRVLSLEDRVFGDGGILDCPQFSRIRDKRARSITVEHLLRHEAGFTMHRGDPMFTTRSIIIREGLDTVPDMDRIIEYALGDRLGYTPGTGFRYSNLGYLILTKIVEVCSGMDYEEYCQENILHPAGCYDMHLARNLYEDRYPNEVRYYETHEAEPVPAFDNSGDTLWRSYGGSNIEGLLGAGAWVASPAEFVRFTASIDGDPSVPDVISPESVRMMTADPDHPYRPLGWVRAREDLGRHRTGTLAGRPRPPPPPHRLGTCGRALGLVQDRPPGRHQRPSQEAVQRIHLDVRHQYQLMERLPLHQGHRPHVPHRLFPHSRMAGQGPVHGP